MKKNTLIILAILMLIGLGVLLIPRYIKNDTEGSPITLPVIDESTVDTIKVPVGDATFLVQRGEGGWFIDEQEVDPTFLNRFWQAFGETGVEGPVSKNSENHERLNVTDAGDNYLVFEKDLTEVAHLIIGNYSNGKTYFRLFGDDNVYTVNADWSQFASTNASTWIATEDTNTEDTGNVITEPE